MSPGDYVRITIDTYDGQESMYGRIEHITHAMGIYSEPVYEVATEKGKSLFDAKELEYIRGSFTLCDDFVINSNTYYILSRQGDRLELIDRSYLTRSLWSEFKLLEAIYGAASKPECATKTAIHICDFRVWPMDYTKSACRECGAWK